MKAKIELKEVAEGLLCIRELDYKESCNCFLIIGSEKCLLIDLGIGLTDYSEIIEKYVGEKELIVVLTHFHFDHYGGHASFDCILANTSNLHNKDVGLNYLKKVDFASHDMFEAVAENFKIDKKKFQLVENGSIIDLGDWQLQVMYVPGHDSSSIALYDVEKGVVFTGDLVYDGELYFDFVDSNLSQYVESLKKIIALNPSVVCGGHGEIIDSDVMVWLQSKLDSLDKTFI